MNEADVPNAEAKARFRDAAPVFLVPDVRATADHYSQVLGFCLGDVIGEPPSFAMLYRDRATIVLQQGEACRNGGATPDAFIGVESVKEVDAELSSRGADVVMPPTYRPLYDGWEMLIRDIDGRLILFTQAN